jgi:hypothetical protein
MKISTFIQGLILVLLLQSCATTQLTNEGELAYQANNYEDALASWEKIIESKESAGKKAKGPIYFKSGMAALNLKQDDKARKYLESAKEVDFSSPELYASLASIYKTIDNLSKEITALETYREKYPQGENIDKVNARLLATYAESENWDLGVALWPELETNAQTDAGILSSYLIINKNLKNYTISNKLAKQILKLDANNITALEYYAEKYFWEAENLYVTEMKAYKNHRTTKQYNKLLKALEKVWPTFKKSRSNFLKLYKIEPKKEYAKYLGKIYTRFDDKKKAAYYNKRAK